MLQAKSKAIPVPKENPYTKIFFVGNFKVFFAYKYAFWIDRYNLDSAIFIFRNVPYPGYSKHNNKQFVYFAI